MHVARRRLMVAWAVLAVLAAYLVLLDGRFHLGARWLVPVFVIALVARWRSRLPLGLRPWPAVIVLALTAGILFAWPLTMELVLRAAGSVRGGYANAPELAMRAIPGNAPEPYARILLGETLLPQWTEVYLAGFTAVPLIALAWTALHARATAALLIAWSHLGTFLLCLPVFLLWPVPDPWYGTGWYDGAPCPWWWNGMHERLVTFTFPSLHIAVGTAVVQAMHRADRRTWVRTAWWVWLALLAASTLALRTHWLIDLPAGVIVGMIAHRLGVVWIRAWLGRARAARC